MQHFSLLETDSKAKAPGSIRKPAEQELCIRQLSHTHTHATVCWKPRDPPTAFGCLPADSGYRRNTSIHRTFLSVSDEHCDASRPDKFCSLGSAMTYTVRSETAVNKHRELHSRSKLAGPGALLSENEELWIGIHFPIASFLRDLRQQEAFLFCRFLLQVPQ